MRRTFLYIFVLLFLLLSLVFFVLLNFRLAFYTPQKTKSLAAQSGLYDFATTYIRDEVIQHSNISINDDASYARLNEIVSEEKVTAAINGGIDTLFAIIDGKNTIAIIPISIKSDAGSETMNYQRNIDLSNTPILNVLRNTNLILIVLAGLALLPLLLLILVPTTIINKLKALGKPLITLAISLGIVLLVFLQILPDHLNRFIIKADFVRDLRLVNAAAKLLNAAINSQIYYYSTEIIALLIIGTGLVFLSRIDHKEKKVIDKL